eukprot:440073-Rhodomonas_salina.3
MASRFSPELSRRRQDTLRHPHPPPPPPHHIPAPFAVLLIPRRTTLDVSGPPSFADVHAFFLHANARMFLCHSKC